MSPGNKLSRKGLKLCNLNTDRIDTSILDNIKHISIRNMLILINKKLLNQKYFIFSLISTNYI